MPPANESESLGFRFPAHWEQISARKTAGFSKATHVTFQDQLDSLYIRWTSRDHRKGKLPKAREAVGFKGVATKGPSGGDRWERQHARPRVWGWDFGDISWWVALLFLVGSIFWCANGVMVFNFFTVTTKHIALCEAVTAFMGGTMFAIGSYLSYVESLNPALDTEFGWEIDKEAKRLIEPVRAGGSLGRKRRHFGSHKVRNPEQEDGNGRPGTERSKTGTPSGENNPPLNWRWLGTDWKSLGFTANFIQLCGALIFWISVLTGLPGILPESGAQSASDLPSKSLGLWEGLYWTPQILGAPCFVISGAMFCYEVQKKWYIPKINDLGWHVGFWNMLGGFGFWFCGIFGIFREVGGQYQRWGSAFSTWWGSWFFLIGSYIQLYESLNKR